MATLNELLEAKQRVLEAELGLGEPIEHAPSKGDVSEYNWHEMLSEFLPGRYQVSRSAFVIDSKEEASTSEIDLVIHDNYFHPIIFEAGGHKYIPAESVYAVFEIKQDFSKGNLEQASTKTSEVRCLDRTNLPVVHAGGIHEPRPPLRILAGILAIRSSWSPPFGDSLIEALSDADEHGRLDLGFAVENGGFEASYGDGLGLDTCGQERGLIFFLTRLFTRLQQLGSAPAIDLAAYDREAVND